MGSCCLIKNEALTIYSKDLDALDHLNKTFNKKDSFIVKKSQPKSIGGEANYQQSDIDVKEQYCKFVLSKCKTLKVSNEKDSLHYKKSDRLNRSCGTHKKRPDIIDRGDESSFKFSVNNTEFSKNLETEKTFSNCEYSMKIQLLPSTPAIELENTMDPMQSNILNQMSSSELSPFRSALKKETGNSNNFLNSSQFSFDNISQKSDKKSAKVRFGFPEK